MNYLVLILLSLTFLIFLTNIEAADNFVFPTDDDKTDEIDNRYAEFGNSPQRPNFNQRRPNQKQRTRRPNLGGQQPNFNQGWGNFNGQQVNPNQGTSFNGNNNQQSNFNRQRPNQGFNGNNNQQSNFNQQRPNQGFNNQQPGFNQESNLNNQQSNLNQQNQNFNQQQFNQNNGQQQQQQPPTPQVQACAESCITKVLAHYDPWCGSDGINYRTFRNREMFDCILDCGERVELFNAGTCPRPSIPPWAHSRPGNISNKK